MHIGISILSLLFLSVAEAEPKNPNAIIKIRIAVRIFAPRSNRSNPPKMNRKIIAIKTGLGLRSHATKAFTALPFKNFHHCLFASASISTHSKFMYLSIPLILRICSRFCFSPEPLDINSFIFLTGSSVQ